MRASKMFRQRLAQLRWVHAHFGDLVRKERPLLTVASLALLVEIAAQVIAPYSVKYVTDGLLTQKPPSLRFVPDGYPTEHPYWFLTYVCVALLVVTVLGQWAAYVRTVKAAEAGQRMVTSLRKRLYRHLHHLPMDFHQRSRFGDLLLRLTGDIPVLRDILSDSLLEMVGRLLQVVVILVLMTLLDPLLASIAIGVFLVLVILSSVFTRKVSKVVRKQRQRESELAFHAGDTLRSVQLVKAYGREAEVAKAFARQNRSTLRAGLKGTRLQAALGRWVEITFGIGTAAVLALGVVRQRADAMTVGDLLLFLSFVRGLSKPLRKMSAVSGRVGKAAACGERILEILDQPTEAKLRDGEAKAPRFRGDVEFRDVQFSYDGRAPALRGVSFHLEPGEHVALVGRNGAGKSTLVQLLLRLYDPSSGVMLLDGVDARRYTLESLRDNLTLVLQDTFLFGSTIRDNIHFAAPEVEDERILAVLDQLGGRFVRELPEGLGTELAEAAKNLSGGERRKILLAGALLRRRPVLILDEPTANIDAGTRRDLVERLPELTRGATTLLVTHDPEMLEAVDRVLWLDGGRIVAEGRHEELLAEHPEYRTLFLGGDVPREVSS